MPRHMLWRRLSSLQLFEYRNYIYTFSTSTSTRSRSSCGPGVISVKLLIISLLASKTQLRCEALRSQWWTTLQCFRLCPWARRLVGYVLGKRNYNVSYRLIICGCLHSHYLRNRDWKLGEFVWNGKGHAVTHRSVPSDTSTVYSLPMRYCS